MTQQPCTDRPTHSIRAVTAGIVLRVATLLGLDAALTWLVGHLDPGTDAPIGAALLAFAAIAVVAFLWAAVDTSRSPVVGVVVTWCAAGALAGIGMVLGTALGPGDVDAAVLRSDLVEVGPFLAGLIVVPALFAVLLVGVPQARVTREELTSR